jgi:hypothetical protein
MESERTTNLWVKDISEKSLSTYYSDAEMIAIGGSSYYSGHLQDSSNLLPIEQRIRYEQTIVFYDSVLKILWTRPQLTTVDSLIYEANKMTMVCKGNIFFSFEEFIHSLKMIRATQQDIENSKKPIEKMQLGSSLILLAPILLSFAAALRITKVTATLLGYTRG